MNKSYVAKLVFIFVILLTTIYLLNNKSKVNKFDPIINHSEIVKP